jgi:hypothetical protein
MKKNARAPTKVQRATNSMMSFMVNLQAPLLSRLSCRFRRLVLDTERRSKLNASSLTAEIVELFPQHQSRRPANRSEVRQKPPGGLFRASLRDTDCGHVGPQTVGELGCVGQTDRAAHAGHGMLLGCALRCSIEALTTDAPRPSNVRSSQAK